MTLPDGEVGMALPDGELPGRIEISLWKSVR